MVQEDLERVVTMLPKSDLQELDRAAEHEGLSRSALIRTLVKRYLREREK
jgi:metal-responsive CopG/Arc/MetJ family transcriptional regulator